MATDCLKELLGGSNCSGTCNYAWQNGNYVLQPGSSCSGQGCEACPHTIDPINSVILRGLAYALGPQCFPNPDVVSGNCGVDFENLVGQLFPVLKRLRLCKFLVKLSIALGIVSSLSLGGLVYALFFR
jgi:hypothetical protein